MWNKKENEIALLKQKIENLEAIQRKYDEILNKIRYNLVGVEIEGHKISEWYYCTSWTALQFWLERIDRSRAEKWEREKIAIIVREELAKKESNV